MSPPTGRIPMAIAALAITFGHSALSAAENTTDVLAKAGRTDPFRVPDGTIEDLQKYIEGLKNLQPSSSLRPAM